MKSLFSSLQELLIVLQSKMALSRKDVFRLVVPMRPCRRKFTTKHLAQVATANHRRPLAVTPLHLHNPVKYNTNTDMSKARVLKKRKKELH